MRKCNLSHQQHIKYESYNLSLYSFKFPFIFLHKQTTEKGQIIHLTLLALGKTDRFVLFFPERYPLRNSVATVIGDGGCEVCTSDCTLMGLHC